MIGKILKLNKEKGYGFIKTEEGEEVYFHREELASGIVFGVLERGQPLRFFVEDSKRGRKATFIIKG